MTPVFPAFAGFIPRALVARYPHAHATPASNWCRFPHAYCCPYLLDPRDPLFAQIGAAFIKNLRAAYGQDPRGYYIADTFNEMRPASADPGYLGASSAAVYAAMQVADAGAVWVMQAWLFFSDQHFWRAPQIKVGVAASTGVGHSASAAGMPPCMKQCCWIDVQQEALHISPCLHSSHTRRHHLPEVSSQLGQELG